MLTHIWRVWGAVCPIIHIAVKTQFFKVGFQYVPPEFFSYLMSHLCCMATTFPTDVTCFSCLVHFFSSLVASLGFRHHRKNLTNLKGNRLITLNHFPFQSCLESANLIAQIYWENIPRVKPDSPCEKVPVKFILLNVCQGHEKWREYSLQRKKVYTCGKAKYSKLRGLEEK